MKLRKMILCIIVSLCAMLSACGNIDSMGNANETATLYNDYPEYETAKDIVETSDYVFTGEVEKIIYQKLYVTEEGDIKNNDFLLGDDETEEPIPYTIYEIKVGKVHKGEILTENFQVKRAGGEYDGDKVDIDGTVPIEKEQGYLFLVKKYKGVVPSLTNVSQSVYKLSEPNKEDINNDIYLTDILELFE